jgi:Cu/Ag efflux pump CusA
VLVDPRRLLEYGLDVNQVVAAVEAGNANTGRPAGHAYCNPNTHTPLYVCIPSSTH